MFYDVIDWAFVPFLLLYRRLRTANKALDEMMVWLTYAGQLAYLAAAAHLWARLVIFIYG